MSEGKEGVERHGSRESCSGAMKDHVPPPECCDGCADATKAVLKSARRARGWPEMVEFKSIFAGFISAWIVFVVVWRKERACVS